MSIVHTTSLLFLITADVKNNVVQWVATLGIYVRGLLINFIAFMSVKHCVALAFVCITVLSVAHGVYK